MLNLKEVTSSQEVTQGNLIKGIKSETRSLRLSIATDSDQLDCSKRILSQSFACKGSFSSSSYSSLIASPSFEDLLSIPKKAYWDFDLICATSSINLKNMLSGANEESHSNISLINWFGNFNKSSFVSSFEKMSARFVLTRLSSLV